MSSFSRLTELHNYNNIITLLISYVNSYWLGPLLRQKAVHDHTPCVIFHLRRRTLPISVLVFRSDYSVSYEGKLDSGISMRYFHMYHWNRLFFREIRRFQSSGYCKWAGITPKTQFSPHSQPPLRGTARWRQIKSARAANRLLWWYWTEERKRWAPAADITRSSHTKTKIKEQQHWQGFFFFKKSYVTAQQTASRNYTKWTLCLQRCLNGLRRVRGETFMSQIPKDWTNC